MPRLLSVMPLLRTYHQPTTAWALKKVWPEITLHIVPDAGHSSRELGITKLLVEVPHPGHYHPTPISNTFFFPLQQATDKFADF
jgi:hypothetical protein